MTSYSSPSPVSKALWASHIPLHITHPSAPTNNVFVASVPRFSYLALLLPRLSAYFSPLPCSSFHFEQVHLRNLPVGLLVDLYLPPAQHHQIPTTTEAEAAAAASEGLPWRLSVGDGVGWDIGDTFLNCVKEADFVRNGNASQIMKMSKEHTTHLWHAVVDNDLSGFWKIQSRLLNAPTALRHVPLRIYVPSTTSSSSAAAAVPGEVGGGTGLGTVAETGGSFKVFQSLVQATTPDRKPRLLGQALRDMMPRLFPSSRDPVLATVVMHGAQVPFSAPLEELMREAAYPDGWLCLVVVV